MNKLFRNLLFVPLLALLMGNQKSCEAPEPINPHDRQLKWFVELGEVQSPSIKWREDQYFDFKFAVNVQIYDVLNKSDLFYTKVSLDQRKDFGSVNSKATSPLSGKSYYKVGGDYGPAYKLSEKSYQAYSNWYYKTDNPRTLFSTEAWCLQWEPQFELKGSILNFALKNEAGLNVGFGAPGEPQSSIFTGFEIGYASSRLTTQLLAFNDRTGGVISTGAGVGFQNKIKLGLGLNIGGVTIGPSLSSQTDLTQTTRDSLQDAMVKLSNDLLSRKVRSYTRVIGAGAPNQDVMINAGSLMNVKEGDMFEIRNDEYVWTGEPCKSRLRTDGNSRGPVAYGRAYSVTEDTSFLELSSVSPDMPIPDIVLGAKVYLIKRVEDIQKAKTNTK